MQHTHFLVMLILSLLVSCTKTDTQPSLNAKTELIQGKLGKKLDSLFTPYVELLRTRTHNEAGLAIGVTQGDQIIYARTFGMANKETNTPATFDTKFHIASVSKPFAAAAIMKLVESGQLSLTDKLTTHIPELKMRGDLFRQITIQQILNHSSGIPRHISSDDLEHPVYGDQADQKTLQDLANFDLDFEPGSSFSYSNSAFDLLAVLVHRVSGIPYHEFVTQNIFKPAGMLQSDFLKPRDSLPEDWAEAYSFGLETQKWGPFPYAENYFPSSGVQSSLSDMCSWGILFSQAGAVNGNQVLDAASITEMTSPTRETPWGDSIGLSWFLQSYLDRPITMHQGNDTGFEALMYVYPESDISIIVMANRDFSRTARIINAVSEVLFDAPLKEYEVSARYKFSEVYKKEGLEKALETWENLKTDTTDIYYIDRDDLLTMGAVLENGARWKDANKILSSYLEKDSLSTYAWRLLGNTFKNLGDNSQAIQCYQKTLAINPNYEKGRAALEAMEQKSD